MSCKVVVVIDKSGSMSHVDRDRNPQKRTYLDFAKSDATTFIFEMTPGDSLGVVAFNETAAIIFGETAALVPITSEAQKEAQKAIMALSPQGETNMTAAFKTAAAMMPDRHGPHDAIVFLSDGYWNVGGDPLAGLPKTPLIYTIALGPASDIPKLDKIARHTQVGEKKGEFHYAPDGQDLANIYNDIAGQIPLAGLAENKPLTLLPYEAVATRGPVPSGTTEAIFAINWDDSRVLFTPNAPVTNEISITLRDPHQNKVDESPATGEGFAVFKIANPIAGEYTVGTRYAGEGSLSCNVAVLDNKSSITAAFAGPPDAVAAGSPATFDFRLADGGDPIDGAEIEVSLESPLVTLAEAAAAHAERLEAVSLPDDIPEENQTAVRIAALQRQTGENLLPRQLRQMTAQAMSGGLYRVWTPVLEKAGSHTIRIVARGYSAKSKTQFQRTKRISFITSKS